MLDSLWSLQSFSPALLSAYAVSEKKRRPSTCSISCQVYKLKKPTGWSWQTITILLLYSHSFFLPSGESAWRKLIIMFSFFVLLCWRSLPSKAAVRLRVRLPGTVLRITIWTIQLLRVERSFSFGYKMLNWQYFHTTLTHGYTTRIFFNAIMDRVFCVYINSILSFFFYFLQ